MRLVFHRCKVEGHGALTMEVFGSSEPSDRLRLVYKGRGPLRSRESVIPDPETFEGDLRTYLIPLRCERDNHGPDFNTTLADLAPLISLARRTSRTQEIP